MSKAEAVRRIDRTKEHRTAFDKNRRRILMTQEYCGICGKWVDKSLKRPDPFAPEVDHIVPIAKGGHPSDIGNLQLVHGVCNRKKGDNLEGGNKQTATPNISPLAWSTDWTKYTTTQ